jgi:pyruvate dehydrogenase E2 component (dihydrolipoamide acetyltransferase)
MSTFKLPDLGEGLQEAEIVAWHVGAGDHVVADQPLVSVETEKAVVEIPSPRSGRIAALHGNAGDILKIGAPLVDFEDAAAADTGTVVGRIPAEPKAETSAGERTAAPGDGVRAAPAVRALAARLGVELAAVEPSGPNGTVTRADVEGAAGTSGATGTVEPLRGVRRAMARNMARAHAEVVPATVTEMADVGDWRPGADVTIRMVRAIAAACAAEPALNAWYDAADVSRRLHDHVDVGIAVDTPDGLIVPTLRDVGNRDAADLRRGLDALKRDVVARTVPLEELRGQTITLSNFGMFSGIHAALVVMPPQVAIIGAGRIRELVLARRGVPVVRSVLPVSLTFDHRAVMGGEASRFLAVVKGDLEQSE